MRCLTRQMIVMKCRNTQILWGLWSPLECFSLDLVKIYGVFLWENISGFFTFTYIQKWVLALTTGADLGGGCRGAQPLSSPPP